MDDQPLDLTPLDPTRDPARLDAIAHGIAADAMAARPRRRDLFDELSAWTRPALAAAAIVILAALPAFTRLGPSSPAASSTTRATDILGIPMEVMALGQAPSVLDLADALAVAENGGSRGR